MKINNKDLAIGILGTACVVFCVKSAYYQTKATKLNEVITKASLELSKLCNDYIIANVKARNKEESENEEEEG